MTKIKITPLRSLFDDGRGFFAGKEYSMDKEQAATCIREGWTAEQSAESDGTAQTDSGDGDDGDIIDDLTDGQDGDEGSDGTGASGV